MSHHELFTKLINGRFDEIPEKKSNIVRIFFSSTFSDTATERDYLIEKIYPSLREYCKTQYGLDFQIIDLRWGISTDANIDHSTSDICYNEIMNSEKYSIGPYFVAFLSHRYGTRDIPNKINEDEFEIIRKEAKELDLSFKSNEAGIEIDVANILVSAYRLDENEVPKKYKLLHIDEILTGYTSKPEQKKIWYRLSEKLSSVLRTAVHSCLRKNLIDEAQMKKYFTSITENEIQLGMFDAKDAASNVIYFERTLKNVQTADKKVLKKYFDMDANGDVDKEADMLLTELKSNKIRGNLPAQNIHEFEVDLKEGISYETHRSYVESFGKTFHDSVKALIDKNAQKKYFTDHFDSEDRELVLEVITHANFMKECVQKFHGRVDLIETIKDYILNEDTQPYVIHGESGSGKTSVIAKVANELLKLVESPGEYVLMLRFLGTTPQTSNMISVYKSLLCQLEHISGGERGERNFPSIDELKAYFFEKIVDFTKKFPEKKLVVFLDSIDQLVSSDYDLKWMFYKLPTNVKFIYSTLVNYENILARIKIVIQNKNNYLAIEPLNKTIVKTILEDWLSKRDRSLSESQWTIIEAMLEKASLHPLFVKLIFDIVIKWNSYSTPSNDFMSIKEIDDCINYLFDVLEREIGKMLFSRCMFYMNIMKSGISENELEDILSLDDELLSNVFEFHSPPIRRFPIALWARIKLLLGEYLVEKQIDETKVIYWYHRRFIEVSNLKYIQHLNNETKNEIIQNGVDYFTEKWKNTSKPFKHNEYYAKKKNIPLESTTFRFVNDQPVVFVSENGEKRYNKRKLNELPHLIGQIQRSDSILYACNYIFFNYEFLHGKIETDTSANITDLIKVFSPKVFILQDDTIIPRARQFQLFILIYLATMHKLQEYPHSLSLNICSHVLMYYRCYSYFRKLIDEADKESIQHCALVVAYQYMKPPGNGLLFDIDQHKKPIHSTMINEKYLITCSDQMIFLNLFKLKLFGNIKFPASSEPYKMTKVYFETMPQGDEDIVANFTGGYVLMTEKKLISSRFNGEAIFTKDFTSVKLKRIILIPKKLMVVQFDDENYIEIYDYNTGELLDTKTFSRRIKFVLCSIREDFAFNYGLYKSAVLMVVLEKGEIHRFVAEESGLRLYYIIPPSGIEIYSCDIYKKDDTDTDLAYAVTFEDGGFCLIEHKKSKEANPSLEFNATMVYYRPKQKDKCEPLKLVYFNEHGISFIKKSGHINVMFKHESGLRVIPGEFQHAKVERGNIVVAISNGKLSFFYAASEMTNDSTSFKTVRFLNLETQFEDVSYFEFSDMVALTSSRDSFKMFLTFIDYQNADLMPKFDYSAFQLKSLVPLGGDQVLVYSENSKAFEIWTCNKGTINASVDVHLESIENIVSIKDKVFFVLGIENQDGVLSFSLKAFTKAQSGEICESFKNIYQNAKDSSLCKVNSTTVLVLSKTLVNSTVKLQAHYVEYKESDGAYPFNVTLVDDLQDVFKIEEDDLTAVSSLANYMFVSRCENIYLIDLKTRSLLCTGVISSQDTKNVRLASAHPIENTNDFVVLSKNSSQVFYVEYEAAHKKFNVFTRQSLKVQDIQIQEHLMALLVHEKIVVFDLKQVKQTKSTECPILKLMLKDVTHFSLSPDCEYLAVFQEPKYLSLYRVKDGSRCAHVVLYARIHSITITEKFVSLGMKDRRVLSFLIADPLANGHSNRIKELPSRQFDKTSVSAEELENNKKLFSNHNEFLRSMNFTPKTFDIGKDIFDKNAAEHVSKLQGRVKEKKLNLIKNVKDYPFMSCDVIEVDCRQENWLIDLVKKNSLLNEDVLEDLLKPKATEMSLRDQLKAQDPEQQDGDDQFANNREMSRACTIS